MLMLPLLPELVHTYDAMLAQRKIAPHERNDYGCPIEKIVLEL